MSTSGGTQLKPLPLEMLERMDAICTDFESLWRAGQAPRLEDFLAQAQPGFREALLEELLHLEVEYRRKRGEAIRSEEFHSRFADDPALVDRVWEDLSAMVRSTPQPAGGISERENRRMELRVMAGPHKGQVFHLNEGVPFLVGRSRRAHFRVRSRDEFISRLHFRIVANPTHYTLLDMGSTNGTYVNEVRVDVADLKDGDLIRAGQTVIRVSLLS